MTSRCASSTATSSSTERTPGGRGAGRSPQWVNRLKARQAGLGLPLCFSSPAELQKLQPPRLAGGSRKSNQIRRFTCQARPVVDDEPERLLEHPLLALRPLVQSEAVRVVRAPAELRDPDGGPLVAMAPHHAADPRDLAAHLADLGRVGIDGDRVERGLDLMRRVEAVEELLVRRPAPARHPRQDHVRARVRARDRAVRAAHQRCVLGHRGMGREELLQVRLVPDLPVADRQRRLAGMLPGVEPRRGPVDSRRSRSASPPGRGTSATS